MGVREDGRAMAGEVARADSTGKTGFLRSGSLFDGIVAVLSALMVIGVAWDFRRHAEGISFAEEGFFTVQHVFFYSMFLGIAAVIGLATVANRRAGAQWVEAVPTGYGWGVVGVLLFGVGGLGDLAWHSAFGFEKGIEGLVSPSHLALGLGATIFLASPLRAAWYREGDLEGADVLSVVLSASLALSIVAMFAGYLNPLVRPIVTRNFGVPIDMGIAMLTAFPLLFVGAGIALCRRFDLPPGALTIVFAVPALASSVPFDRGQYAAAAIVAGLVADALVTWRRPVPGDTVAIRLFSAVVPATFAAVFFAVVQLERGIIIWTTHLWTGAIVLPALAGLLLSYAVAPPSVPQRDDDTETDPAGGEATETTETMKTTDS